MADFHETRMGRKFYEVDIPEIAKAMKAMVEEFRKSNQTLVVVKEHKSDTFQKKVEIKMEILMEGTPLAVSYDEYKYISEFLILHGTPFKVSPIDDDGNEVRLTVLYE